MSTIYVNFLAGTTTTNPLTLAGTTVNSSAFENLPVVADPDIMWLVLDPEAVHGEPELVKVTAHEASATSVTVEREQQSTAAREHPAGTVWRAVLTKTDLDTLQAFLAPGAVGTTNLAPDSVTNDKIAPGAVGHSEIGSKSRYSAIQTITSTATDVVWDTEIEDDLELGAAGSATLTIPADGVYMFVVELDSTIGGFTTFGLYWNGTAQQITDSSDLAGVDGLGRWSVHWTGYLREGDVIRVRLASTGASAEGDFKLFVHRLD